MTVPDPNGRLCGRARRSTTCAAFRQRREAGRQLNFVQDGGNPTDWKPMPTVGHGVLEIRIHVSGEHRVLFVATLGPEIYVLHAFEKKSRKTGRRDIELARRRYRNLRAEREGR